MTISYNDHTLKPEEISELNKQGHNLDESKDSLYIIRFLWNNELNKAYQPHPFRVVPELNEKLAKEAIDMPYIVGPDPEEHLKGSDGGEPDTVEGLLKIQADYSIGDIKAVLKSQTNNNHYGIIKIYPNYHDDVENNKIPQLVSPTFAPLKWKGHDLLDANFININSINSGGYPVSLTKIVGTCKNGIKQCMRELAPYAAAGSLRDLRSSSESFSSTILGKIKPMSQQGEITLPDLAKNVEDLGRVVSEQGKSIEDIKTSLAKLANGKESGEGGTNDNNNNPPAGAAGPNQQALEKLDISKHPQFVELQNNFDEIKKLADKREKQIAEEEAKIRVDKATSIVEMLNKGKKLSDDDKAAQIKNWVEKKDADDNLENLDLVESTLKAALPQANADSNGTTDIASASGPEGIPEINSDVDPSERPSNSSIMANTTGRLI